MPLGTLCRRIYGRGTLSSDPTKIVLNYCDFLGGKYTHQIPQYFPCRSGPRGIQPLPAGANDASRDALPENLWSWYFVFRPNQNSPKLLRFSGWEVHTSNSTVFSVPFRT